MTFLIRSMLHSAKYLPTMVLLLDPADILFVAEAMNFRLMAVIVTDLCSGKYVFDQWYSSESRKVAQICSSHKMLLSLSHSVGRAVIL